MIRYTKLSTQVLKQDRILYKSVFLLYGDTFLFSVDSFPRILAMWLSASKESSANVSLEASVQYGFRVSLAFCSLILYFSLTYHAPEPKI